MGKSRRRRKYVKILRGVRIPTWALGYLVNSDDSGLDVEDKATIAAWIKQTGNGGIDVCPPSDGESYFCSHPAFGLACDVEDCDVVVDMSPWYQQNPCIRFGQSRFGPSKRTAIDGGVWWCMYDYKDQKYVTWYRFKTRRQALVQLAIDLLLNRLPYEPDPGFYHGWLAERGYAGVVDLVGSTEAAYKIRETQGR